MLHYPEHFQVLPDVLTYLKEENSEGLKLASWTETFEMRLKACDEVLAFQQLPVLIAVDEIICGAGVYLLLRTKTGHSSRFCV